MPSLIAWLDASSEDQRRMREIVNLFSEHESRDELGIGQVRDALSDLLWPGTSVLFTRARYFLFIPWCFRAAAESRRNTATAKAQADQNERRLIAALLDAGEKDGVIGVNVGKALKSLPSVLYWGGMRVHGILSDPTLSRDDAVAAEVERLHMRRRDETDYQDEDSAAWPAGAFHVTLPEVPSGFPADVATGFAMSRSEAEWLRDRMLSGSPDTLLEFALHQRPESDSRTPWEDATLMTSDGEPKKVLDDARRFSTLMNSAALLYNLLLAEAYENAKFTNVDNPVDTYRERLKDWANQPNLQHDVREWDRDAFWGRVLTQNPAVNTRSRRFIDGWLKLLIDTDLIGLADNESLRAFIRGREHEHKRGQARLTNTRLLQAWQGSAGSRPLVYRWPQLRPVLRDLHDGLELTDA